MKQEEKAMFELYKTSVLVEGDRGTRLTQLLQGC